jgi:hypothetical protein
MLYRGVQRAVKLAMACGGGGAYGGQCAQLCSAFAVLLAVCVAAHVAVGLYAYGGAPDIILADVR